MASTIVVPNRHIVGANVQEIGNRLSDVAAAAKVDIDALQATLGAVTLWQLASGTLVAGTATIATGITVTAATRAFPIPSATITGSANFGSLSHPIASNVAGAPGVGAITVRALGNDGALDADAAGAFHVLLAN
jgi:hypothetical protein